MAEAPNELSKTISLIRKAREGDGAALERLFARYALVALDCARRLASPALKRKFEPEDLAQSALTEVWRDFRRFEYREIGSLDRFVRHVVENKIKDKAEYLRAQRRDPTRERSLRRTGEDLSETATLDVASPDLSTTQVVRSRETRERLDRAIQQLPEEQAAPLRLHLIEGLSHKEVAQRLGLPGPDAARMRIQRARQALRQLFGGEA